MTDTMKPNGNGDLPPAREAIVEQAQRIHQEVSHERDMLLRKLFDRDTEIAGLKSMLEVAELNATQLDSKMHTMMLVRDQAVADRAVYEALFISMQAQMRAFAIPGAPLIVPRQEEEQEPQIGGA